MALHGQDGHADGQQTGGAPKPENRRPPQPAGPVDAGPARANAPRPPALLHSADGRPQPPGGQVCLVKSNNFTTSTAHFISIFAADAQHTCGFTLHLTGTDDHARFRRPPDERPARHIQRPSSQRDTMRSWRRLPPAHGRPLQHDAECQQGRAGCSLSVAPARRGPAAVRMAALAPVGPPPQTVPDWPVPHLFIRVFPDEAVSAYVATRLPGM